MIKNDKGMTLIEVTIAIFLFAVFITAFMTGQGDNISDSIEFKGELLLKDIAEMKMNETIINPPQDFRPTAGKINVNEEKKKFEQIEEYPDYQYAVQLFKVTIPEFEKITGKTEEENNPNQDQAMQKRIFDNFKRNMEQLVWQIIITVEHKPSGATYDLSTWYYNPQGRIQLDIN
jgi:prepilin-type N-terminal cleavage/methylation domain-containing protein